MNKQKYISLFAMLMISVSLIAQSPGFYDFKVKTLEGEEFDFSSLKGKKVMVVNVASKCGLTPQYKDLEEVYEKYQSENFVIIRF